MVGVVLAFGASRLGKEGVGDLDSAACGDADLGGRRGLRGAGDLHRGRCGRLELLVVARQSREFDGGERRRVLRVGEAVSRLARMVVASAFGRTDEGLMARSSLGIAVFATVAPWSSLHPFRGKGRSINEPKPVGIRDLVAAPGDVKLRPSVGGT